MTSAGDATFAKQPDGSLLLSGKDPDTDTYTITTAMGLKGITAFRLEALADVSLLGGGPGRRGGNFVLTELEVFAQAAGEAKPRRVGLRRAVASWEQNPAGHTAAHAIDGNTTDATGWAIWPKAGESHWLVVEPAQPLNDAGPTTLTFVLHHNFKPYLGHTLGRLRLSVTTHPAPLRVEHWRQGLASWKDDPWTARGAAYHLSGEDRAGLAALAKGKPTVPLHAAYYGLLRAAAHRRLGQVEEARRALAAGLESLSQVEGAEEPLLALALEAIRAVHGESPDDVKVLAPWAKLLARVGRREAAAAAYAKLAQLEPKNEQWSLPLAQLQPDRVAFWNFDFDAESWQGHKDFPLHARGGVLHYEGTGKNPNVQWNVSAPAGCKELTLRLRTRSALGIDHWWATTQPGSSAFFHSQIEPSDEWQTVRVYLIHDSSLTGVGLRFSNAAKTVDIDAAELRSVDVPTALKELTAEIADKPNVILLRYCRGTLYGSLGQWEQALADFQEITKRRQGTSHWRFFDMVLAAQTGDRERYLQHRREALQQLAKGQGYAFLHEVTARAALLLPSEGDDLKQAAELADRAVKGDQNPVRLRRSQLAKGLAEYRGGAFTSGIEWLEKSRQLLPESPTPHLEAQALLLLAMAHERLGEKDKARELLAQAAKLIDEKLPKPDSGAWARPGPTGS